MLKSIEWEIVYRVLLLGICQKKQSINQVSPAFKWLSTLRIVSAYLLPMTFQIGGQRGKSPLPHTFWLISAPISVVGGKADYAHHITTHPPPPTPHPDFHTFLRPCCGFSKQKKKQITWSIARREIHSNLQIFRRSRKISWQLTLTPEAMAFIFCGNYCIQ